MTPHPVASIDDLPGLAKTFITRFPHGGIFPVQGEMGAGKTTFVRAVCEVLGAPGAASPTFGLVNEYATSEGLPIVHMDLYRIKNRNEALDFGFEEYLNRPGYLFIEWPDLVASLLPADSHPIRIEEISGQRTFWF